MKDIMYQKKYSKYFEYYKEWKIKGKKFAGFKYKVVNKLCRNYFEKKFPILVQKYPVYGLNTDENREHKIIASLTTFPKRIKKVWISISTIMRQSIKPDAIELYLSHEQFPNKEKDLPQNLLSLKEQGLSICFCDGDLKSHKKYFYAMQRHPDDIIITFDDDIFYPKDTVETLYKIYKQDKACVVGISTPKFSKTDFYSPIIWGMQDFKLNNSDFIGICGGAGSLFPPNAFKSIAFDEEKIKKFCPYADDLWLTAMTYISNRKISSAGRLPFPLSVPDTQEIALTTTNNSESASINNDTQWQAIISEFSEDLNDWKERIFND